MPERQSAVRSRAALWAALGIAFGTVAGASFLTELILETGTFLAPLRSAFRFEPRVLALLLSYTGLALLAALPVGLARWIATRPSALLLAPVLLLTGDSVAYLLLRLAFTGSVFDLLTGPLTLSWPREIERLGRTFALATLLQAGVLLAYLPTALSSSLPVRSRRRSLALGTLVTATALGTMAAARALWLHWSGAPSLTATWLPGSAVRGWSPDLQALTLFLLVALHAALLTRATARRRPALLLLALLLLGPGGVAARTLADESGLRRAWQLGSASSGAQPHRAEIVLPPQFVAVEPPSRTAEPTEDSIVSAVRWSLLYTAGVLFMTLVGTAAELFAGTLLRPALAHRPRVFAELPPAPRRLHLGAAALGWSVLIIYGSLVPLTFRPLALDEAITRFAHAPYFRLPVGARQDFVANILLYLPLGFLALGALRADRRGATATASAALGVFVLGTALAFGVEFLQLWFPPRTVSYNDIVAETIGTAIGIVLWIALGTPLLAWARTLHTAPNRRVLLGQLLTAYGAVLVLGQLMPYDAVIAAPELHDKLERGRIVLLPFAHAYPSASAMGWALLGSFLLALPLGALVPLAASLPRVRPHALLGVGGAAAVASLVVLPQIFLFAGPFRLDQLWPAAAQLSLLAALPAATLRLRIEPGRLARGIGVAIGLLAGLEGLQLFVYSRYFDPTDVLTGALGVALGATLTHIALQVRAPSGFGIRAASWRLLAAIATGCWCVALLAAYWYPMDFQFSPAALRARLPALLSPPFRHYYWGTEFHAFTELSRKIALALPLGVLAALALPPLPTRRARRLAHALLIACAFVLFLL
ncbi:MAG: VanZ family protein, partial [Planctomycetota bacterium]